MFLTAIAPLGRSRVGINSLRLIHSVSPVNSIYNSKKPQRDPNKLSAAVPSPPPPPSPPSSQQQQSKKSTFQDAVKQAQSRLLANKYYQRTPNFLKPYVAGFLTRPVGFGVSFFILHEITAIVPLVALWYVFIKFNWIPLNLPTEFILKGTDILTGKLMSIPDSKLVYDKATIIIAGANAYAATKLMMPARLPLSVALTPWFDRVVVQRIGRLFKKNKKQ